MSHLEHLLWLLMCVQLLALNQAEEDPKLYWEYLNAWMKGPSQQDGECWTTVLNTATASLTPGVSKVWAAMLASQELAWHLTLTSGRLCKLP